MLRHRTDGGRGHLYRPGRRFFRWRNRRGLNAGAVSDRFPWSPDITGRDGSYRVSGDYHV